MGNLPDVLRSVLIPGRRVTRATRIRTAVVALLALPAALVAVALTASPAAAQGVETASPAPDSTLAKPPAEVRLTFEDLVFPTDFDLSVTGPGGDATDGGPTVFGHDVTQPLKSGLAKGRYTVSWNIEGSLFRGADRGSLTFRVGAAPAPRPSATAPAAGEGEEGAAAGRPRASNSASGSPTTSPSAKSPSPEPTRLADPAATKRNANGFPITGPAPTIEVPQPEVTGVVPTTARWLPPPPVWWALLVAAALGAVVWRRRRNREDEREPTEVFPEPLLMRQTELVLGSGPGLTDGPRPPSLTPVQGVAQLAVVPPSPTTDPDGVRVTAAGQPEDMFAPNTPPMALPRVELEPAPDEILSR
jgi:methionine-rich copper-binding protein CopC